MRITITSIFSATLLAVALACGGGGSSTPAVTAPTISTFTASASVVDYGQPVTLGWTLGGSAPTSVTMKASNTLSTVTTTVSGSSVVTGVAGAPPSPKNRQTYTLTVTNSAGTASKAVTVASRGVDQFTTATNAGGNLAKDSNGNLYAQNHKLNTDGSITTFGSVATNGLHWSQHDTAFLAIGGFTNPTNSLYRVDLSGNATVAISDFPYEYMTVAKDGTIYAAAPGKFRGHAITVIHPNGATSTITGDNQFFPAGEMVLDATESNLYVMGGASDVINTTVNGIPADVYTYSNTISKINLTSMLITTVAGQFNVPGHADGVGTTATFNTIGQAILSNDGTALYLCDIWNGLIRKMDLATLQVTTVAGTLLPQPYTGALAFHAGTYTGAVMTPMGITQNANGDLVFSVADAVNGVIAPRPICTVTLP